MNKVILMGRLVHDPELRVTPQTNSSVARFSLAVNRTYKASEGQPTADFFNVVAWKGTADFVGKYFKKGQQVLVEGNLKNRNWEDKDHHKRISTEVHADQVYFADSKREASQGQNTATSTAGTAGTADHGDGFYPLGGNEEDLPF